jgi:hypothetical protein
VPNPLRAAFAALKNPETEIRARRFPVASRGIVLKKLGDLKRSDARAVKKLIRPENADVILADFPSEDGDMLHAITCGDFVFCDFILRLIQRAGIPRAMTAATLSLSLKNVEKLAALLTATPFPFHLVLSHYFKSTSGEIFRAIESLLVPIPGFRLTIGRCHAKVTLLDYPDRALVIESSANLRSSRNIEQITAKQCRALHDFHLQWIEEFATSEESFKTSAPG